MWYWLFSTALLFTPRLSFAAISPHILTTTQDIQSLVKVIAPRYTVESLTSGNQNPHHLDIKPSHIVMVQKTKLIVAIGLGYEEWLEKLNTSQKPVFVLGPLMNPEKDTLISLQIHPEGNPHLFLDPERVALVAPLMAEKLGQVFPNEADDFKNNAVVFSRDLRGKIAKWKEQLIGFNKKAVVTYHSTFHYFLARFGLENRAVLESHPGIAPSPQHLLRVISVMKKEKIDLFLMEDIYPAKNIDKLKQNVSDLKVLNLPSSVGGDPAVKNLEMLYEKLVASFLKRP